MDVATHGGYDVRFVRVKLEVCDRSLIPAKHMMPFKNPEGQRRLHELEFEIESEKTEGVNAWVGRK